MPAEPAGSFRVSCPRAVLHKLRAWAEQAVTLGIGVEFVANLRDLQQKFATEPLVWGEQRHTLPSGRGCVYQGAAGMLHATYGVNEVERVVFVIEIRLMPNSPLTKSL